MTDHATLRTLAEAATPGPWVADAPAGFGTIFAGVLGDSSRWLFDPVKGTNEDAALIAACDPQTIIALLDELETLRAALEDMTADRDSLGEAVDRFIVDRTELLKVLEETARSGHERLRWQRPGTDHSTVPFGLCGDRVCVKVRAALLAKLGDPS